MKKVMRILAVLAAATTVSMLLCYSEIPGTFLPAIMYGGYVTMLVLAIKNYKDSALVITFTSSAAILPLAGLVWVGDSNFASTVHAAQDLSVEFSYLGQGGYVLFCAVIPIVTYLIAVLLHGPAKSNGTQTV